MQEQPTKNRKLPSTKNLIN